MNDEKIERLTIALNRLDESLSSTDLIDRIFALTNRLEKLADSNKELQKSIEYLNAAVNDLTDAIKKR